MLNAGINFETDGLTGFPKLDDTANDTYGGAIGVEYLFNLNQQVVFEVAGLNPLGRDNNPDRISKGHQVAFGARSAAAIESLESSAPMPSTVSVNTNKTWPAFVPSCA